MIEDPGPGRTQDMSTLLPTYAGAILQQKETDALADVQLLLAHPLPREKYGGEGGEAAARLG